VLTGIPAGAQVTVYGAWQGWYVVHYENYVGYAAAAYIPLY
jgi:N-acetylmuramoyl-L-alanine amidase